MTKPSSKRSSLPATADTVYTVGLIAAEVGEYRMDIVRDALETAYPKFFGKPNKTCILIDEKTAFRVKAIANNEKMDLSEVILKGLEAAFSQYLTKTESFK